MIDPKLIREDIDNIRVLLKNRNMEAVVDLDRLKIVENERRETLSRVDKLRAKRNSF